MTVVNDGLAEIAKLTGSGTGGTQFDEVALGSDNTAPAATQSALISEIVTNGGSRKTGANVTGSLLVTNFTSNNSISGSPNNDTMRWVANWSFSGSLTINEFGVFNGAGTDIMLLRQTFSQPLNVVNGDTLELTIDVVVTAPNNDTTVGASDPGQVLTEDGIDEGNRLIVTDVSPNATGTGTDSGRFNAVCVGRDTGGGADQLPLAVDNSGLGLEYIDWGLSRATATVSTVTTNVTDDTTRFVGQFTVSGAGTDVDINEVAVANDTDAPSDDATAPAEVTTNTSGIILLRHIFADTLWLVDTDQFTVTVDVVNTG